MNGRPPCVCVCVCCQVTVFDANVGMKNTVIGVYEFDVMSVYYRENHELWRQWVAIVDPYNPKDKGIQGYLKVSVVVLGPSDKLVMHTPQEEAEKDAADASAGSGEGGKGLGGLLSKSKGGDMDSLCLMPPSIKQEVHFLVLSVYRAEGLPRMDERMLGGLVKPGIDAYVQVEVSGKEERA